MTLSIEGCTVVTWPGEGPVRGDAMAAPEILRDRTIVCRDGVVDGVGTGGEGDRLDASGLVAVPGFVDCHTHLPFFGWRGDEDAARLSGVRYEDIHGRAGGIFRSARMLAEADDDKVVAFAGELAGAMLRAGTTAFELKSGYGLSVEAELRQLELARRLSEAVPQRTTVTCLAGHAVPERMSQGEWIGTAAGELLPEAAARGLASACDVYVESIAFALEHAARLSEASFALGLRMRVHSDQLADNQTASFAARWGFASADHLNHTSADGVSDLAASDTAAVLLPGATFTLRQAAKPPARALIDSGAIVALGTDLNPGTSPIYSMLFAIALACRTYGLRPAEALCAATVNSAYAAGFDDDAGRIAAGGRADIVLLDVPSIDEIAYRPDRPPIAAVICRGDLVHVGHGHAGRISPSR